MTPYLLLSISFQRNSGNPDLQSSVGMIKTANRDRRCRSRSGHVVFKVSDSRKVDTAEQDRSSSVYSPGHAVQADVVKLLSRLVEEKFAALRVITVVIVQVLHELLTLERVGSEPDSPAGERTGGHDCVEYLYTAFNVLEYAQKPRHL